MKNLIIVLAFVLTISGCAVAGSSAWHKQRIQEIELACQSGQFSPEKCMEMKLEADRISSDFYSGKSNQSPSHVWVHDGN